MIALQHDTVVVGGHRTDSFNMIRNIRNSMSMESNFPLAFVPFCVPGALFSSFFLPFFFFFSSSFCFSFSIRGPRSIVLFQVSCRLG